MRARSAVGTSSPCLAVAGSAILLARLPPVAGSETPLFLDDFALFFRWLALAVAAIYVAFSFKPLYHGGTPENVRLAAAGDCRRDARGGR